MGLKSPVLGMAQGKRGQYFQYPNFLPVQFDSNRRFQERNRLQLGTAEVNMRLDDAFDWGDMLLTTDTSKGSFHSGVTVFFFVWDLNTFCPLSEKTA